jgi:hypothetical protein
MVTVQQKLDCVLWLTKFKSITHTNCKFRFEYGGSSPSYIFSKKWDRPLRETGSVVNQKSPWCPKTPNKDKHIRQMFLCSLRKLICTAIRQVHLPHSMTYLKVYIYMHTNCSCGCISNQLTVTVETDVTRKCCRKLTVMRFFWTLCFPYEATF